MFLDSATQAGGAFADAFARWGVPGSVITLGTLLVTKLWPKISPLVTKLFGKLFPGDRLQEAGVQGVQGVIDILNNQLKSMQSQMNEMNAKLRDMEVTLAAALAERDKAVNDALKARSDLYSATLKLERFGATIEALGGKPPE